MLQRESGTTRIIDPWGGSFYVERLTAELAKRAWSHIHEVEDLGGMAKAIEAGVPKMRIEEAAARTQARIDAGEQAVIGVNRHRPEHDAAVELLKVDNAAVRQLQIEKLEKLRRERDPEAVAQTLAALTRTAGGGNENLMALAIDAARARATVGEISAALEQVYGRHRGRGQGDLRHLPPARPACRRRSSACASSPPPSPEPKAAARASWSPRPARTATTAARR